MNETEIKSGVENVYKKKCFCNGELSENENTKLLTNILSQKRQK